MQKHIARAALAVTLAALPAAFYGVPATVLARSPAATALSTVTLPNGSRHTLMTPAGLHVTVYATGLPNARFMALGPRGDVFVGSWYAGTVSVLLGSSCNECVDPVGRAVIMHYRPDGSGGQTYARGLRNAVGLAWQPGTGRLWATDNGEDTLGDNIPPDEVDIMRAGGNYGWP